MPGRSIKRRRLSPPAVQATAPESLENDDQVPDNDFLRHAAKWNLEQDYEQRPRKLGKKGKEDTRLPIKTYEGKIEHLPVSEPIEEVEDGDSFLDSAPEEDESPNEGEKKVVSTIPIKQQIVEAKEELARLGTMISEDPEENSKAFKRLNEIADTPNLSIKKLALATELAVYKDIIPGYRIRPLSEADRATKVSKDVRRLRDFEQSLVAGYQKYVQDLASSSRLSKKYNDKAHATVAALAVSCACALLTAVPHFNFRGELMKIVVEKLSAMTINDTFMKAREALETLFREDEDGGASLEAVTLLAKMMRAKDYRVDESVLNTFLSLRLLSELPAKASQNKVDKIDQQEDNQSKKSKAKREFRTKKQRKIDKERRGIEKEMREADAVVGHEERDRMQSETLKIVFATYFRILKAQIPGLMGAVLEGLAKYTHLINQDFFGDLLEGLRELVNQSEGFTPAEESEEGDEADASRNVSRESLLCIITAFALLEGQDVTKAAAYLHLDLSFFIARLYRNLYSLALNPDIEMSAKSLHLPDPNSLNPRTTHMNKINVQTTIVLLLRALTSILLPSFSIKSVPPLRVAAFSKQLMTSSLQTPEKSSVAILGLMNRIGKTHGSKVARMWSTEERKGDGNFNALGEEIESSNPFATTIWEGQLLRKHFCPAVREASLNLDTTIQETISSS
ncbi:MAG: hypothetical protein M1834_000771 [Cirrosporium novae-zelandiae]|nr:MAG: hypothetical protein M1834_000771 [Cirrosporium novae-zelandiae]